MEEGKECMKKIVVVMIQTHTHTHTSCYNSTQCSLLGTENCLPLLACSLSVQQRCNHLSTQFTNVSHI